MSTFFGFNIARSGLFTAQKALSVVSHNIANAETPGYSRQRVEQHASNPIALSGGRGMLGTGVDSTAITQIRNEFLDIKYRGENTVYGQWKSRYESLSEVEAIMNEPSKSGIRSVMDDFFSSIQELSKDPSSLTTRAVVRERGVAMANTLNHMHSQLEKMVRDTDFEIKTTVDQINTYANDISKLNEQIFKAEMDGNKANDLRDQRNLLMDELSKLVNVEVKEMTDGKDINAAGKLILSINGQPLVSHDKAYKLTVENKEQHSILDNVHVGQLQWELGRNTDGTPITTGTKIDSSILKGQLRAQLDMRDNIDGDSKGIPYYIDKLNEFTNRFAAEFNAQHFSGYGLNESATEKVFFQSEMFKDGDASISNSPSGFPAPYDGAASIKDFVTKVTSISGKTEQDAINMWSDKYKGFTIVKDSSGNWQEYNIKGFVSLFKTEGEAIQAWEAQHKTLDLQDKEYTIAKDDAGNWYQMNKISAKDIKISDAIQDSQNGLDNIAAAKTKGLKGDASNISAIGNIRYDHDMFDWGSPDDFVKSLISNLGVDAQTAKRMSGNQEVLVSQIDMQRQSISGVSLDEEMTNMVKFQHAYNAAARMITTVDEMIDVIINRMGRVGL